MEICWANKCTIDTATLAYLALHDMLSYANCLLAGVFNSALETGALVYCLMGSQLD